jgi:hypothetical protein
LADGGTIVLIVNDPGDGTPYSHRSQAFRTWWHPQSGYWLMRCSTEAAPYFCAKCGCRIAPDALQDADR